MEGFKQVPCQAECIIKTISYVMMGLVQNAQKLVK